MINLTEPERTEFDLSFRVAGFPVRIHPLFWLMGLILGALSAQGASDRGSNGLVIIVMWIGIVFVSILVHELGHAVLMRYHGEAARIVLYAMGGLAISEDSWMAMRRKGTRQPGEQVAISAAGPVAGFLFAGVIIGILYALGGSIGVVRVSQIIPYFYVTSLGSLGGTNLSVYWAELFGAALFVNIYWGMVNLVPVFPLDGGQIARAIFIKVDPWDGIRKSLWVSVIVGGLIAVFGLGNGELFIGLLFASMAFSSWQLLQQSGGRGGPGVW